MENYFQLEGRCPLRESERRLVKFSKRDGSILKMFLLSRFNLNILPFSVTAAVFKSLQLAYLSPHSVQFLVNSLLKISILVLLAMYCAKSGFFASGFPLSQRALRFTYCNLLITSYTFQSLLWKRERVTRVLGNQIMLRSIKSILSNSSSSSWFLTDYTSAPGSTFSS